MYDYQKSGRFFAQIAEGIKELGMQELDELGGRDVSPAYGGIYFNADREALYRINYCARLVSRVLAPVRTFPCFTADQLYTKVKQLPWSEFISEKNTFAVFSNVSHSKITNSRYATLRCKDAVVDAFREGTGSRPAVDSKTPDFWLNLHIRNNKAVLSIDTSGGSLHRRGLRKESVEAPMQETVAAAIIRMTGWDGAVPLYDPMCGSGTLLAEALFHYCRIPSGVFRKQFGFEHLPDFDRTLWKHVKKEVDSRVRNLPRGLIGGGDASSRAVAAAKRNLCQLAQGRKVRLDVMRFSQSEGIEGGVIVINPPYGIRMGREENLGDLYKKLGDYLKQKCRGSAAYVFFGKREYIKKLGLKPSWKKPLASGGLDGRLVKYELF